MALALLFTILLGAPEPVIVKVPLGVVDAISGAQQRASITRYEEAYCFLGKRSGDTVFIRKAFKPAQHARLEYDAYGNLISSTVTIKPCPSGTVADLHTHPWNPGASHIDRIWFRTITEYDLHFISFTNDLGLVAVTLWEVTDNGSIRQLTPVLHEY